MVIVGMARIISALRSMIRREKVGRPACQMIGILQ